MTQELLNQVFWTAFLPKNGNSLPSMIYIW